MTILSEKMMSWRKKRQPAFDFLDVKKQQKMRLMMIAFHVVMMNQKWKMRLPEFLDEKKKRLIAFLGEKMPQ